MAGLKIWFKVAPIMGIAFWLGLSWRPANAAGAWASAVSAVAAWWLATQPFFVRMVERWPIAKPLWLVWHRSGSADEIYEPWQIAFYLAAGTIAGVVVSLLTRPVDPRRLELFYALTRTPIAEGEVVNEPCTLPVGAVPPARPMMVTAFGLEIPWPSRTSWLGFFAGWGAVALLIGSFFWLVRG